MPSPAFSQPRLPPAFQIVGNLQVVVVAVIPQSKPARQWSAFSPLQCRFATFINTLRGSKVRKLPPEWGEWSGNVQCAIATEHLNDGGYGSMIYVTATMLLAAAMVPDRVAAQNQQYNAFALATLGGSVTMNDWAGRSANGGIAYPTKRGNEQKGGLCARRQPTTTRPACFLKSFSLRQ